MIVFKITNGQHLIGVPYSAIVSKHIHRVARVCLPIHLSSAQPPRVTTASSWRARVTP
jgi:hypothetical protein